VANIFLHFFVAGQYLIHWYFAGHMFDFSAYPVAFGFIDGETIDN